jgi:hypothetical protein
VIRAGPPRRVPGGRTAGHADGIRRYGIPDYLGSVPRIPTNFVLNYFTSVPISGFCLGSPPSKAEGEPARLQVDTIGARSIMVIDAWWCQCRFAQKSCRLGIAKAQGAFPDHSSTIKAAWLT